MTYQLDTSGAVQGRTSSGATLLWTRRWSDLSPFVQGYIEALFAAATRHGGRMERTDSKPGFRRFSSKRPGFADLAPETLARIIADCEAATQIAGTQGGADDGRTFHALRQQGWQGFQPLTVTIGDDGKVRFAD